MAYFPLEIWSLVAGQLKVYAARETKDLLALCLVSRDFNHVAAAWLYRSLSLDRRSQKSIQLLAERMTSKTACHVREIVGTDHSQLNILQSLVRKLPALRRFKWNHLPSIPHVLLEDLNQIESLLELDLRFHVTLGRESAIPASASKGYMKLAKLALSIRSNKNCLDENSDHQEAKNMILQAPALKSLAISIENYEGGDFPPLTSLPFFPDEVLPPLETLKLENYALGRGGPYDIENRLDVAKLQTLCLRGVTLERLNVFIRALLSASHQINLKCFSIEYSYRLDAKSQERWHSTLDDFLESFVGLESLVLQGECASKMPSLSAIIKHGKTLRHLKINWGQAAKILPVEPQLSTTAEELRMMCKSCPHLRELSIDIDHDDQPNGFLRSIQESLRSFPSLRKLEIHTQLSRVNFFPRSFQVDRLYVDAFAARVRSPQLRHLTIWVGKVYYAGLVSAFRHDT